MKALVMTGPWALEVQEIADPTPGPDEVVVRIAATGICGSDFHGFTGDTGRRHAGQVMGHETVGYVEALGAGVADPALAPGALVTINPVLSCDACEVCASGNEQSCPNRKVIGVAPELVSAFADKIVVRASNVVPLAPGLDPELGALVEPLAVGYHAAVRGGCGAGDRVLVIGGGPIGQACFLAAQRLGASAVAVSDVNPLRRDLCASLGATVLDPTGDGPGGGGLGERVAEALGGKATLVIDAVGLTPTLRDAIAASTFGARIVLVGMGAPTVELPAYGISTEERTLVGSFCYSRDHFAATAAWVGSTDVPLARLIDGRVGYAGAAGAFTDLAKGATDASKILVFPAGVSEASGVPEGAS